jgi:iron-sulfur cluster assembly accessory protein
MNNITLTPAALQHLQHNIASAPPGTIGVRVGLRDAGCSGFAYTMDFTSEHGPADKVFEQDGIKIFVTTDDLKALKGTEIDLVQEGVNSVLEFNNPNVVNECGCGESFQFKEDTA